MAKDDIGGVWRTIGGRRVFIKDGQSLGDAMKASGKFNHDDEYDRLKKEIGNDIKKLQKEADKKGILPSELQDKLGIKDSDLGLKDDYTEKFENEMQNNKRYVMAEEAKRNQKELKGPDSKEVREINDRVTKDWGSSELEDTKRALASAERYLEKHPDDERMKKRVEIHKKDIARLERQEKTTEIEKTTDENKRYNTREALEEQAEYYKNKAEEYRNTKDPMFADIKDKRAEEYQQKWEEKMKELYPDKPASKYKSPYIDMEEYRKENASNAREKQEQKQYKQENINNQDKDRETFKKIADFYGYNKMDNYAIKRTLDDAEKKGLYHSKNDIEAMRRYLDRTVIEKDTGSAYSKPGKRWEVLEESKSAFGDKIYKVRDEEGNISWEKASKFETKTDSKMNDALRRKAYQKYLKEHPNSKLTFEDFKDMRK